jgi:hypothetical protein
MSHPTSSPVVGATLVVALTNGYRLKNLASLPHERPGPDHGLPRSLQSLSLHQCGIGVCLVIV